jgi:hypothetical protein
MEASIKLVDDSFLTEEWTEKVHNFSHIHCDLNGKTSSTQTKTGGPNKTPFRQTYHQWSCVEEKKTFFVTLQLSKQSKVNLNSTGELETVSNSFQAMSLVGNIFFAFVVYQNETLYITKTNLIKKSFTWNLIENSNLVQKDFTSKEGSHPDFSKGILEFGYITMNSVDSGKTECISGVGSWRLTLKFNKNLLQMLNILETSKLELTHLQKQNKTLENDLKVENTKSFEANFLLEKSKKKNHELEENLKNEELTTSQLKTSFNLLTKQLASRNKEVNKLQAEVLKLQQKIDEINEMNVVQIEIKTTTCEHPHIEKTVNTSVKQRGKVLSLEELLPEINKMELKDFIEKPMEDEDGFVDVGNEDDSFLEEIEKETKLIQQQKKKEQEEKSTYKRKVIGIEKNKKEINDDWEIVSEKK